VLGGSQIFCFSITNFLTENKFKKRDKNYAMAQAIIMTLFYQRIIAQGIMFGDVMTVVCFYTIKQ